MTTCFKNIGNVFYCYAFKSSLKESLNEHVILQKCNKLEDVTVNNQKGAVEVPKSTMIMTIHES